MWIQITFDSHALSLFSRRLGRRQASFHPVHETVAVGTQALQILEQRPVTGLHVRNPCTCMMNLDAGLALGAAKTFHRVEAAAFAEQTPVKAPELLLLRGREPVPAFTLAVLNKACLALEPDALFLRQLLRWLTGLGDDAVSGGLQDAEAGLAPAGGEMLRTNIEAQPSGSRKPEHRLGRQSLIVIGEKVVRGRRPEAMSCTGSKRLDSEPDILGGHLLEHSSRQSIPAPCRTIRPNSADHYKQIARGQIFPETNPDPLVAVATGANACRPDQPHPSRRKREGTLRIGEQLVRPQDQSLGEGQALNPVAIDPDPCQCCPASREPLEYQSQSSRVFRVAYVRGAARPTPTVQDDRAINDLAMGVESGPGRILNDKLQRRGHYRQSCHRGWPKVHLIRFSACFLVLIQIFT